MLRRPSEHKEFDRGREKDSVAEPDDSRTTTCSFPEPAGETHAVWSSGDPHDCRQPFWHRFNVVNLGVVLSVTNTERRSFQIFILSI